ncbi:hypothetical protein BJX62DRAFT_244418 [Aspergillus germanicus]
MASTVYIGHLAHNTTAGTIDAQLSQQGLHPNMIIMTNRGDGSSRDFGFIRFPNEQKAQTAIAMFNHTQIDGSTVKLDWAKAKPQPGSGSGGGSGSGSGYSSGYAGGGYSGGGYPGNSGYGRYV